MGWSINNSGWWGEGEIKFFIDGDAEYPTICHTHSRTTLGKLSLIWTASARPQRRLWACTKCSNPMAPTGRSIAMPCIAGM